MNHGFLGKELGFEKRHNPIVDTGDRKVTRTRMKDSNGIYGDISKVETKPRDMTAIRMNVDNIREAYDLLSAYGFKKAPGIEEVNLETARALLMVSPSGFAIEVIEHIKD